MPLAKALLGIAVMLVSLVATAAGELPTLKVLRFDESYWRLKPSQGELIEELKQFPANGDFPKVSVGGEVRTRYTYTSDADFGAGQQDSNGAWLQRLEIHADARLNNHMRTFLQLNSALAHGSSPGPSPVDENQLEFQNAFIDLDMAPVGTGSALLRLGRQELNYGSGRMINVREGPNVRRTFNAIRTDWLSEAVSVSALLARPMASRQGVFDDKPDDDLSLWGAYSTWQAPDGWPGHLDYYVLGYKDKTPTFVQPVLDEERLSIGTRAFGSKNDWDWDWEAVVQIGDTNQGDIRAWTLATNTGYAPDYFPLSSRLALSVNVASGDKNPDDSALQSFNALFPRGNYFSEAAVVGPRNFYNAQLFLTSTPAPEWQTEVAVNWFWRFETQDGVYTPSGAILRMPGDSDERFVGTALSFTAARSWGRYFDASAIYTVFFPGKFIEDSGPAKTLHFIELTARFRF